MLTFKQLVQEIEVVVKGTIVSQHDQEGRPAHVSTHPQPGSSIPNSNIHPDFKPTNKLDFDSSPDFQRHLAEKSKTIKPMIESLFSNLAGLRGDVKPDVLELESQVSSLLEKEKEYIVKVDRLNSEKDDLSEQLDTAMLRYVKAEKRLDRAKSAQVQKLDSQAFAIATRRPAPSATENGQESGETNGNNEELQLKYREAEAVMAKQKEQLESALSEMKTLREENSSLKARRESLTDEDYVRTDVFKQFKHQNEDLIKRINDLETTNKQLRHEAEKLQTERHSFRTQLEREAETVAGELEDQIQIRDQDLTRIRSTRDELMADQSIRKASQEQERSAVEHMKELVGAREDRISALELELERLRPSAEATSSDPRPDVEALSQDELREKYLKLEKDFESINKELPSIEKAYKRTVGLAQKKVMDFTALEEKVTLLTLEKSKADQKYFAVRKDADINATKLKTLQSQNNKSSEIITALKEHDAQARALVSNLEKQLTDLKQSNVAVMEENRGTKSSSAEALRRSEQVKTQITELQNLVKSKDSMTMAMKEQTMKQETEVERLKVRFDDVKKERDTWKTKSLSNISDDEDMLRVSLPLYVMLCMAVHLTCVSRILRFAQFAGASSRMRY